MAKEIKPAMLQEKTRYKAIAVAAVMAFILGNITAYALSGTPGTNEEDLPYLGTLALSSILYFILIYMLTLLVIGLFSNNAQN